MVKYRTKTDWASYKLSRVSTSVRRVLKVAQWQSWLRHSREDTPSLRELVEDIERRERVRRLAKVVDEKWKSLGSGNSGEVEGKLRIGSSEEALQCILLIC